MNMEFKRKMPSPQEVKDMYSVTEEMTARKKQNDKEIRDVFTGKDNRPLLGGQRGRRARLYLKAARGAGEGQG